MNFKPVNLGLIVAAVPLISVCPDGRHGVVELRLSSDSSVDAGRWLIGVYLFGACLAIPGVPGMDITAAAPLKPFYERIYLAGLLPNEEQELASRISDLRHIVADIVM